MWVGAGVSTGVQRLLDGEDYSVYLSGCRRCTHTCLAVPLCRPTPRVIKCKQRESESETKPKADRQGQAETAEPITEPKTRTKVETQIETQNSIETLSFAVAGSCSQCCGWPIYSTSTNGASCHCTAIQSPSAEFHHTRLQCLLHLCILWYSSPCSMVLLNVPAAALWLGVSLSQITHHLYLLL